MKKKKHHSHPLKQQHLFQTPTIPQSSKFISVYRLSMVRDRQIEFETCQLSNSSNAHSIIRKLIETQGQPDREQFCIVMLNVKNVIIGLNIVSVGDLSSSIVQPRELMKAIILANAAAIICAHNHPSGDTSPSSADIAITKKIIQASKIMGIQVHEHLIISMDDERFYSFADNGIIRTIYDEVKQDKVF